MKVKLLVLAAAAVSILGVRAYAHHSFAATYFEDQKVTVKGKLVQFLYRNPHSFVHVEGPDDKGEMQTWAIEWGAGGQLGEWGRRFRLPNIQNEICLCPDCDGGGRCVARAAALRPRSRGASWPPSNG